MQTDINKLKIGKRGGATPRAAAPGHSSVNAASRVYCLYMYMIEAGGCRSMLKQAKQKSVTGPRPGPAACRARYKIVVVHHTLSDRCLETRAWWVNHVYVVIARLTLIMGGWGGLGGGGSRFSGFVFLFFCIHTTGIFMQYVHDFHTTSHY